MDISALQQALSGQGQVSPQPVPESERVQVLERRILVLETQLTDSEKMIERLLNRPPEQTHNHYSPPVQRDTLRPQVQRRQPPTLGSAHPEGLHKLLMDGPCPNLSWNK